VSLPVDVTLQQYEIQNGTKSPNNRLNDRITGNTQINCAKNAELLNAKAHGTYNNHCNWKG
jgi:hypothetical protein